MDEYDEGEVSADDIDDFVSYYKEKNPEHSEKTLDELYDIYGMDWNGGSWEKDEDGSWHTYSTYNPDSKWDWYQVGGRWTGYFKLKPGATGNLGSPGLGVDVQKDGTADVLLKKDIDIEAMRNENAELASKTYDTAKELIDLHGNGYVKFEDIKEESIETKRSVYREQPLVKAFNEARDTFGFFANIESFMIPREEYIENARNNAIVPYAFITPEGEWVEKGSMGWWGMSNDEFSDNDWAKKFNEYLDSLPDSTRIALVDCHI